MQVKSGSTVIAQSNNTVLIEGNHYFPPDSIKQEYFKDSETHTSCYWKGIASYYDVQVDGKTITDAAWYYPETKDAAAHFKNWVAFYKTKVNVED